MLQTPSETLDKILQSLHQCSYIQYVAYRTAAKLRLLQNAFYVDKLPVDILSGILTKHRLTSTANAVKLTQPELSTVLQDVFFVISQQLPGVIDVDHAVGVLSHFLVLVLQKDNEGVELLSAKIVLTILCGSKPRDKYSYLFSQLADHNGVLTARRLELLLQRLVLLTAFLGEGNAFGKPLVPGTVSSCFEGLSGGALGVPLDGFIEWLSRDPQLLVWISTLHRLQLADAVVHDVKCAVCKAAPIVGLRYRCLRCLSYNQCQECFFAGKVSQGHKKKHQVQEYCFQSTAGQTLRAFLSTLGNKIRRSGWKMHYLPAEQQESYIQEATLQLDQLEQSAKALFTSADISEKDVDVIIAELEEHSRRLLQYTGSVEPTNLKSFLQSHRTMMDKQIERLRLLKKQLVSRQGEAVNSTPFIRGGKHTNYLPPTTPISPITADSLALTWDQYDIAQPRPVSFLTGGNETAPRVLAFTDEGESSSSDSCIFTLQSHGYSWLQSTNDRGTSNMEGPTVKPTTETPEDIRAMQDDLDAILDRLQLLLSNSIAVKPDDAKSSKDGSCSSYGEVMKLL